ncbi:MAG: hypothetical protein QXE06_08235 [Candidatus Bathyarchaeia archaeon]
MEPILVPARLEPTNKWGLEQFFKALGFKGSLEDNARAYLSQKRNYEEDLKAYFKALRVNRLKTLTFA